MFTTLKLNENEKNVVILHGALKDKSDAEDGIGLPEAINKGIDYLALGHYHTYSAHKIDRRGTAAYCGTPEGRGFDELGELGFCTVDTDGEISHRFIPSAKRCALTVELSLDGITKSSEINERARAALENISSKNLVRLCLIGSREADLTYDTALIERLFEDDFYYFEVKDRSRLAIRAEDYKYDKSLRGEFIKLCLADNTIDDSLKEKIKNCGLCALRGDGLD
jgi:DNA repair exonuclease SbcCD nuclease subunit